MRLSDAIQVILKESGVTGKIKTRPWAEKHGITRQLLYPKGKRKVTRDTVGKVADALGVPLSEVERRMEEKR